MAIVGARKTWKLSNQRTRATRGPLIPVQHPDGHWTKMYEADAVEQGLIPAPKRAPAPENKLAPLPANKQPSLPEDAPPDNFTSIEGVGKASARSLVAQGITTFAQLRAADLDSLTLSKAVRAAIEAWRG